MRYKAAITEIIVELTYSEFQTSTRWKYTVWLLSTHFTSWKIYRWHIDIDCASALLFELQLSSLAWHNDNSFDPDYPFKSNLSVLFLLHHQTLSMSSCCFTYKWFLCKNLTTKRKKNVKQRKRKQASISIENNDKRGKESLDLN